MTSTYDLVKTVALRLKAKTKAEVFEIYVRECLPRIHCAKIHEQRKGWMIYDILRRRYGQELADETSRLY